MLPIDYYHNDKRFIILPNTQYVIDDFCGMVEQEITYYKIALAKPNGAWILATQNKFYSMDACINWIKENG